MSDDKGDKAVAAPHAEAPAAAPAVTAAPSGEKLTGLMAAGDKTVPAKTAAAKAAPDLDGQALRAAEQALAEGERALATARAHLHEERPAVAKASRGREVALRVLLAINVLAMLVVAMLPTQGAQQGPAAPATVETPPKTSQPAAARFNEPWNRALAAAENKDFAGAVTMLEQYLAASPRMAPGEQLNVLMTLSHYAARANDIKKSQQFRQRADALEQSHQLPEDLVAMAEAALKSGDQEALRRVWARFLLQQRQIPSWLYKHVAEAYLQLGDSYRQEANTAEERERLRALEAVATRLRAEALQGKEGK